MSETITINTSGKELTTELKALEAEIFPQRKGKRVHIRELQEAWAAYMRALDLTPLERFTVWIKRVIGGA